MRIEKITWIDAQTVELKENMTVEDTKYLEPLAECVIVGHVVHENKFEVIVAKEYWPDHDMVKYVHRIPKVLIKERKVWFEEYPED